MQKKEKKKLEKQQQQQKSMKKTKKIFATHCYGIHMVHNTGTDTSTVDGLLTR